MITITPMKDLKAREDILKSLSEARDGGEVLAMSAGNETLGWVAVDCVHSILRMLKMNLGGNDLETPPQGMDRMTADSLMRAAASYGANHGAYRIECRIPALFSQLRIDGFEEQEDFSIADLGRIVRYTGEK